MFSAFLDSKPCSVVVIYRCIGTLCYLRLHFCPEDGNSPFSRNTGLYLLDNTVFFPEDSNILSG
jgi:hypothetical protein